MDLYYYTTAETMKFIVTKGDIFATNVGYLNDSDEYINGLRELRNLLQNAENFGGGEDDSLKVLADSAKDIIGNEIYNEKKLEASDIYSISFSQARDLLSQWHMYSRESGVQIKMCFEEKKEYLYKREEGEAGAAKDGILRLRPVYYLTQIGMPQEEYHKNGREVLQEFQKGLNGLTGDLQGEFLGIWKRLAPYIKNYGFRQEEEQRAIFISSEEKLAVQYRNDNGVMKPYLDITMTEGWPICAITIGPGRNQDKVYRSICHFLSHSELKINKVGFKKIIEDYFEGLKEYQLPEEKIKACAQEVLALDSTLLELGVSYADKIKEVLTGFQDFTEEEKRVVDDYLDNNFFCDKGIIVNKSKWPYEF